LRNNDGGCILFNSWSSYNLYAVNIISDYGFILFNSCGSLNIDALDIIKSCKRKVGDLVLTTGSGGAGFAGGRGSRVPKRCTHLLKFK
jgi:hypothetical protein